MWELEKFRDNIAVITETGEQISYAKLAQSCSEFTSNIKKRCLIFNLCRNEIGSLVGYVGCLNAKIVPLMVKSDLDDELLHELINTYKPDYINLPSDIAKKFSDYKTVFENLNYTLLKTSSDNASS